MDNVNNIDNFDIDYDYEDDDVISDILGEEE